MKDECPDDCSCLKCLREGYEMYARMYRDANARAERAEAALAEAHATIERTKDRDEWKDRALTTKRELAEARGLLERVVKNWKGAETPMVRDVRAYLDRTRPAPECADGWHTYNATSDNCVKCGAAPAQAPSGPPTDIGSYPEDLPLPWAPSDWVYDCSSPGCEGCKRGDGPATHGLRAPSPEPRCHYCDHEDPYHSPHCSRPARRGAP